MTHTASSVRADLGASSLKSVSLRRNRRGGRFKRCLRDRRDPWRWEWLGWYGLLVGLGYAAATIFEAPKFLPQVEPARTVVAVMLGAQAAVIALALMVLIFALDFIQRRPGLDDDIFKEYTSQLLLRRTFQAQLVLLASSATLLLMIQPALGETFWPTIDSSIALVAVALFAVATLIIIARVFGSLLNITTPSRSQGLRRLVLGLRLEEALEGYAARVLSGRDRGLGDVFHLDSREQALDEKVNAAIEQAEVALEEHRLGAFRFELKLMSELVEQAMAWMEDEQMAFGPPEAGWTPWPPLQSIRRQIPSMRRDLFKGHPREFLDEMQLFDRWMMIEGARRLAGELFAEGVNGFDQIFSLASRSGDVEMDRAVVTRMWRFPLLSLKPLLAHWLNKDKQRDVELYFYRLLRLQSRYLEIALRQRRLDNFEQSIREVVRYIQVIPGDAESLSEREALTSLRDRLLQLHRTIVMAALGLALVRHRSGALAHDIQPYLDVGRRMHDRLPVLADDLRMGLEFRDYIGQEWLQWETEGIVDFETVSVRPEDYLFAFFSVRALELVTEESSPIRLGEWASWARDQIAEALDAWTPYTKVDTSASAGT